MAELGGSPAAASAPTEEPTTRSAIVAADASPTLSPSEDPASGNVEWVSWAGADTAPTSKPNRGVAAAGTDSRAYNGIVLRRSRAAAVRRAGTAARLAAATLCLVALAVLGADQSKGWANDSYTQYSQLRYCETVNAIGFVYSIFQLYAELQLVWKEKHLIPRAEGKYIDFFMDQILAYLLISAASSSTARISDWIINWGTDPFPSMANGAIAISYLAFSAFAVSSLISAYNLFNRDF